MTLIENMGTPLSSIAPLPIKQQGKPRLLKAAMVFFATTRMSAGENRSPMVDRQEQN
jgi:hypothetical protein